MSRNLPPNLGELLVQPNFGQSRLLDKPGDPIVPTQMLLDVTQIRRYEKDPRQHTNPQFAEIKASIQAQGGINNPLTVTRRPGEEYYIIEAGGNTRLRALQELWQETGDERFHYTHVVYKPWEAESQILTRHLIENELRGEMLLVDKALGLEALRRQWAVESGMEDLSRGEFHRRLKAAGLTISERVITRLRFVAQIAQPLAQATADPGFGLEMVDRIMALHGAARRFWTQCALAEEDFLAVWERALTESDAPEISLVALQHNLACRMAEWIDKEPGDISLELDCLAYERRGEPPGDSSPAPSLESGSQLPTATDLWDQPKPEPATPGQTVAGVPDPEPSPEPSPRARTPVRDEGGTEEDQEAPKGEIEPSALPFPVTDIKSLKARAYVLAQRIAQHYRMGSIVAPGPKTLLGYFLTDFPHNAIEAPAHIPVRPVWWLLYGLCHQELVDPALLDQHTPPGSIFREISPSCDPRAIGEALMREMPPDGLAILRAISTTAGRELQDIIDLMGTYRELRRHVLETQR